MVNYLNNYVHKIMVRHYTVIVVDSWKINIARMRIQPKPCSFRGTMLSRSMMEIINIFGSSHAKQSNQ